MKIILLAMCSFFLSAMSCNSKAASEIVEETPVIKKKSNDKKIIPLNEYIKENKLEEYEHVTFAGGCFWCVEASFHRINGVVDVISGYSGGHTKYPTYYEVGSEKTGHAEAVEIFYDPAIISFEKLLEVFYVAHDGTQLNRQGPDKGTAYRSAIFYKDEKQKVIVEAFIKKLEEKMSIDIVTQIALYEEFWVAEAYHQNYYELHPNEGYVANVSRPKVEKVKKTFPDLIKKKL